MSKKALLCHSEQKFNFISLNFGADFGRGAARRGTSGRDQSLPLSVSYLLHARKSISANVTKSDVASPVRVDLHGAMQHASLISKRSGGVEMVRWNCSRTRQHFVHQIGRMDDNVGGERDSSPVEAARRRQPASALVKRPGAGCGYSVDLEGTKTTDQL